MSKASVYKTYEAKLIPSEWKRPNKKTNPVPLATASNEVKRQVLALSMLSTQLCGAVRDALAERDELDEWIQNGAIPEKELKAEWKKVRSMAPFQGMANRFQTSALFRVQDAFSSWLKARKVDLRKLSGSQRWLDIVKSDVELMEISDCDIEVIKERALEIIDEFKRSRIELEELVPSSEELQSNSIENASENESSLENEEDEKHNDEKSFFSSLFDIYEQLDEQELLTKCAVIHLLKNYGDIASEPEKPAAYESRIDKKKKSIERLSKKLKARFPRFREILDTLIFSILRCDSSDEKSLNSDQRHRQGKFNHKASDLPYSVLLRSRDDIRWVLALRRNLDTQVEEERIFVQIKGIDQYIRAQGFAKYAVFEVCCDRRHYEIFRQCFNEWQLYKETDDYSTRAFLLQSASLVWKKKNLKASKHKSRSKIEQYDLYLQISIDARNLTMERGEETRLEEISHIDQVIASYEAIQNEKGLSDKQREGLERSLSTRRKLENKFSRPSKPPYQGDQNLILGISFDLEKVVAAAVVNIENEHLVIGRSAQQLLGENYRLLSEYRHQQRHDSSQRRMNQRQRKSAKISRAQKGLHIDRLFAKALVILAEKHRVGCIALADCKGIRERIQSGIEAKAEKKFPKDRTEQQAYLKDYRRQVHSWDYHRLTQCILDRAGKIGIPVEVCKQPYQGHPLDKAKTVALSSAHFVNS